MRVVPAGVAAGKAVLSALRRNEVVALVCDLPKEGRNVLVRMLGQLALVPAGPALLSLREGAPVVPITCRRLPDDRHHLTIEEPVGFRPSGYLERDLPLLAQAIIDRFEVTLRAMPEQWYLFSPMWGRVPASSVGAGRGAVGSSSAAGHEVAAR